MNEIFLLTFFIFVVGACIGSFLNVVALRALSGESIVFPNSKCPECKTPIKWYDNIPILSYFFTVRGKCRSCGCKISIQYPIVETLTAVLFFCCVYTFGFTLKTLFLLILLCMSIVLSITDIKEHVTDIVHLWIFIAVCIISSLYFHGISNYMFVVLGIISGIVVMEIIAKSCYYLCVKDKKTKDKIDTIEKDEKSDEEIDEDTYIHKAKRVFGEGDTYLAAGMGALLGWKYVIAAIILGILLQAICAVPLYLINLYKQKQFKLLISLSVFLAFFCFYLILINFVMPNLIIGICIIVLGIALGVYIIKLLRNTMCEIGNVSVPMGPALLVAMFAVYFYGPQIVHFLKQYLGLINS